MKNFALFSLAAVLASACANEKQALTPTSNERSYTAARGRQTGRLDVSSYATVPKVSLATQLKIAVTTIDGNPIESTSALRPNTDYYVTAEGSGLSEMKIRACFGFDLLGEEKLSSNNKLTTRYLIKTNSDVSEPLFISVMPIHQGKDSRFREQAQTIALTKGNAQ